MIIPEPEDRITEFTMCSMPEGRMLQSRALYDCGLYGMIIDSTTRNSVRKMYSPEEMRSTLNIWAGGASE